MDASRASGCSQRLASEAKRTRGEEEDAAGT